MTICIAMLCQWHYKDGTIGQGVVAVSDRMRSAVDIQHEAAMIKAGFPTPQTIILVADDISVHSEAMRKLRENLDNSDSEKSPHKIATLYSDEIQSIRRRRSEVDLLSPLAISMDQITSGDSNIDSGLRQTLINQLQSYNISAEAIVAGIHNRRGYIFHINSQGQIFEHTDQGFCAIGIGYLHANLVLMRGGFGNLTFFTPALTYAFAAKKQAESAPGVGKITDIYFLTQDGRFPIPENVHSALESAFDQYTHESQKLVSAALKTIDEALGQAWNSSGSECPFGNGCSGFGRVVIQAFDVDSNDPRPRGRDREEDPALSDRSDG